MATPKIDSLSYAELLKPEERIKSAISTRKAEDAKVTKEELKAMAAKAGSELEELFGNADRREGGLLRIATRVRRIS